MLDVGNVFCMSSLIHQVCGVSTEELAELLLTISCSEYRSPINETYPYYTISFSLEV